MDYQMGKIACKFFQTPEGKTTKEKYHISSEKERDTVRNGYIITDFHYIR